jgi:hypothetical protein
MSIYDPLRGEFRGSEGEVDTGLNGHDVSENPYDVANCDEDGYPLLPGFDDDDSVNDDLDGELG